MIKWKNGFALIELVASLCILSVLLTTVFTFYFAEKKTYYNENEKLSALQHLRIAFLWLSTSIKQAKSVKVISESEIKVVTGENEIISYYFKNGTLYRQKNTGTNPIAELSNVSFHQFKDSNYIQISLTVNTGEKNITINTKATPLGYIVN